MSNLEDTDIDTPSGFLCPRLSWFCRMNWIQTYQCHAGTTALFQRWIYAHADWTFTEKQRCESHTLHAKSENIILPSGGHWITVDENGVILTCPLCRLLCKCIEASCCCFPSHRSQLRHQIHLTTYWNANQTRNLLYLLSCCCKGSSQENNCVCYMQIYVNVNSMVIVHSLSSINSLNVQGVNSIAMNTINISVVVQLQT